VRDLPRAVEGVVVTFAGLTVEDLEAMPEDGRRYELIGGAIVMTPAPEVGHQRASRRLQARLEAAWPAMEVFAAPVDVDLPGDQRVQPDLVVVERGRTGKRLALPVELVVEIVSPGSAVNDRVTKLDVYAAAGIVHYWVVDLPAGVAVCYVLKGDGYRVVTEGPVIEATQPVAVRIDVAALTDPAGST
jgi:Uma2 family endonuclease